MNTISFSPLSGSDAHVTGYLHTPLFHMEGHREQYPAVVICPGGAYSMVSPREADPVAQRFFAAGYHVFILTYSVEENAKDFRPLLELSKTFSYIREKAAAWHLNPFAVGVCGFSAGGHLAASLGTLWNHPQFQKHGFEGNSNRPNAMILAYPVITADAFAHVQSIENVSGCSRGTPGYEFFSLDRHVTSDTCPTFLWHTVSDDCVPVENTLAMISALQKAGVSYEAHLFPRGGHGLSVCTAESGCLDEYNARWVDLCLTWLNREFSHTP